MSENTAAQEAGNQPHVVFTPQQIAARNQISLRAVYYAISKGRLKVMHLGTGKRGSVRITPEQEREWHNSCAAEVNP